MRERLSQPPATQRWGMIMRTTSTDSFLTFKERGRSAAATLRFSRKHQMSSAGTFSYPQRPAFLYTPNCDNSVLIALAIMLQLSLQITESIKNKPGERITVGKDFVDKKMLLLKKDLQGQNEVDRSPHHYREAFPSWNYRRQQKVTYMAANN